MMHVDVFIDNNEIKVINLRSLVYNTNFNHKSFENFLKKHYKQNIEWVFLNFQDIWPEKFESFPNVRIIRNITKKYNIDVRKLDNGTNNFLIGDLNNYHNDTVDEILKKRTFEKKFLCLNNEPKEHRLILYNFIKLNDSIYKNTFLSHNSSYPHLENHEKIDEVVKETSNKVNDFYYKSFCNVITETFCFQSQDNPHITEKTDKSLFSMQPFIVVSTPFYLKKLKELGFKTFDKWWDESYDEISENHYRRLYQIKLLLKEINKKSLDELREIYQEMIPILIHNKKKAEYIFKLNKKYRWNKVLTL